MTFAIFSTLAVLACVLGHGLVLSFNLDLSKAVQQIGDGGLDLKAAEPYLNAAKSLVPAYVRQFQQKPQDGVKTALNLEKQRNLFSSFLLHGAPIGMQSPTKNFGRLSAPFRWMSCSSSPVMEIKAVTLKPNTLHFPGRLNISFDVVFHDNVSSSENVTVVLNIFAKAGGKWVRIPCIGPVGSCTYVDFCQVIAANTCPKEFSDEGVPCKCPFKKGEYKLRDFSIDIDAAVLLADDYKGKVQISSDTQADIACYEVFWTVN